MGALMRATQPAARRPAARLLLVTLSGALSLLLLCAPSALASKTQWSIIEDHSHLVQTDPQTRERMLDEVQQLGADTLRIEVKWNEVAPGAGSRRKPTFDATDPAAYPGFGPYDALVASATARKLRIVITITGDAPRWATSGGRGGNFKPSASEYASFVRAVVKRYSGTFAGLPKVGYYTIWNEPNHIQFLKPTASAPRVYRQLVAAAVPALRQTAPRGTKVFVGELKPSPRKGFGPLKFLRQWLCLDSRNHRLRGRAARKQGCTHFKKINADGFAHHPYGPIGQVPAREDLINLLAIRRLAKVLDMAARAKRLPRKLPIYNTEFGLQTNPPDIFISTSPARQAQLIDQMEQYAYRYSRLKSHSQYLLYDDPGRAGPPAVRWSGFQTGLHFANGKKKPAWDAYRLPIVVNKRKRGRSVLIWGRVRPNAGSARSVQIQKRSGRRYVNVGSRLATNSLGYFSRKLRSGTYRFVAYARAADGSQVEIGNSRTASPT
jgi:hypothetical protein